LANYLQIVKTKVHILNSVARQFFSKSLYKFQTQRLRLLLTIPPTKEEQISQISTGQVEGKKKWRKLPTLHLKPLNCWANKLICGRVMSGAPNRTQQNRTEAK